MIKLQVQEQLGGRTGIPGAVTQPSAEQAFGNVKLAAINLPGENVGGNVSAILRTGQAWAQAYQQIGSGLVDMSQQVTGYLKAEDDTIARQTITDMKLKREEIANKNEDRVRKNEITWGQYATENQREFEDYFKGRLGEVKTNFSSTVSDLEDHISNFSRANIIDDVKKSEDKIYETKRNDFTFSAQHAFDNVKTMADIIQLQPHIQELLNDPMAGAVGLQQVTATVQQEGDKAVKRIIVDAQNADPIKFKQDISEGLYDLAKQRMSEDEWKIVEHETDTKILQHQNAMEVQLNKQSQERSNQIKVQMEINPLFIPSMDDIKSLSNPQDQIEVLRNRNNRIGLTESETSNIYQAQQYVEKFGSYVGAPTDIQKSAMKWLVPNLDKITDAKTAVQSIGILTQQGFDIDLLDQQYKIANQPPVDTTDIKQSQEWASSQQYLKSLDNQAYKKYNSDNALTVQMIQLGNMSYQEAKSKVDILQNNEERSKIFKQKFGDGKSNPYKQTFDNLESVISEKTDADIIDPAITSDVKSTIEMMALMPGNLSVDERVDQAFKYLGLVSSEDSTGKTRIMRNSPESFFTERERETLYDPFKQQIKNITDTHSATNYHLEPTGNFDPNKPSWTISNHDNFGLPITENGKPVLVTLDKDRLRADLFETKKTEQQSSGFKFQMKEGSQFARLNERYPSTVGKYPNLINSIYIQESSAGKNTKDSPKGAQGPFQFIPSTAAELGVKNPQDFYESSTGAAKYMDQLLNRYHGDLNYALAAYNWGLGNVDNWLTNSKGDVTKLPLETQNYIKQVTRRL